uniref:Ornithine cyclodeaminase n=1 Tax=Kalanchoe fedtschenkoi TaxID=63787 RepID=A0A7N0SVN9_KALFE
MAATPMFISVSAVRSTLTYQTLIQHLRTSLPSLTPDTFTSPHRQNYAVSPSSSLLLMPAWSSAPSLPYIGVKLVTCFPANSSSSLPGVHGSFVLFSSADGQTLATMDGTELTHWRTACVSALASQLLSSPHSETLLMVGAGYLAPHLINAHLTTRPGVNRVVIWNRKEEKARQLANKLEAEGRFEGVVFESCGCLDDVVEVADIVSCATSAAGVALVKGGKLKKGAHLDLVGSFTPAMAECDDEAIRRGRVFVDNEAALVEAGELVGAFERGVIARDEIAGSLVELIKGETVGRRNGDEITVFKSVGSAAVDLLCAQMVYEAYITKANEG